MRVMQLTYANHPFWNRLLGGYFLKKTTFSLKMVPKVCVVVQLLRKQLSVVDSTVPMVIFGELQPHRYLEQIASDYQ